MFENTIAELSEYRKTKLAEERDAKLKSRKELKKVKQKAKNLEARAESEKLDDVKENEAFEEGLKEDNVNLISDKDFCEHLWQKYY